MSLSGPGLAGAHPARRRAVWGLVAAGLLLCGCARTPPVLVRGGQDDLARLAGTWAGTYASEEAQRAGTITFTLDAGADTARGRVEMIPRGWGQARKGSGEQNPANRSDLLHTLKIRFVSIEGRRVEGMLETYHDPDFGGELETTFLGTLTGDRIEGTYTAREASGDRVHRGHWEATRAAPP